MTEQINNTLKLTIERLWHEKPDEINEEAMTTIKKTIDLLDTGNARVAEKDSHGNWNTNEWLKMAVLLHFKYQKMFPMSSGDLEFYDKVPLKHGYEGGKVRVIPPATVRWGAYLAPGVVLMPCYINIGAYVGQETMIDTWATVGTCAQIGSRCHISGGVGIGGVLEPIQAEPVIIEDEVFIGARSEVAEGVIVRNGAVLAMGCYVGATTKIFNSLDGEITYGEIPSRAVVVPGSLNATDYSHSTYALIIKKFRDKGTDAKTALNDILR